ILLSQYLSFIICSCNHENQCFDQKKQQCKLVDGKEYIGKEKRYGYCVIDAIKYDLIDFCKSDYEPVCISQDRKSCIKVQNSNHIVATLDSGNICIELKYIKQGFCQDLYGRIKLGQAKQNVSVLFLCNYLEGGQFRKCKQKKSCYLVGKNKCLDLNQVDGITSLGFCVFQNQFYLHKVYCNDSLCQIKNSLDQYACISYSNSDIFGKTGDNQCIYQGQYFPKEHLINCKPQYCIFQENQQKKRKNILLFYNKILALHSRCILYQQKTLIYSHKSFRYCFNGVYCVQMSQSPGKLNNQNCAAANQYYNDLESCVQGYCIKQQSGSGARGCFPLDGSESAIGIDNSGNCIDSSIAASSCYNSFDICKDYYTSKCTRINSNSTFNNICILNGICYQMSFNYYVGRDNKYQCLQNQQQSAYGLLNCYDSTYICKTSNLLICVYYLGDSTYLGKISSTGICAQIGAKISTSDFQSIINLNLNYCQDDSYTIQLILPVYAGRDQCAQLPIVCFDGIKLVCQQTVDYGLVGNGCSQGGNCQSMSSIFIGRDTNYKCFYQDQTPQSGTIDKCFNDTQTICLTSDKKQCILYAKSSQYLGCIQSTGICAQLGQQTSNQALQIIVNLNKGYCQDNQFRIQQLLPPYVGRDSVNQLCLQETSQSSQIEFCVQGYCIANNKCQPVGFDKKLIAKLSNQQCGLDQTSTAIECAYQSLDVCMDKTIMETAYKEAKQHI
ncbi:hypothetical protein TTHERM_01646010, partial (macronuclear) [Tetrahymena thermophila SB210]